MDRKIPKLEPKHDYVLVENATPDRTDGGIIIPETIEKPIPRVRVLAAGPGVWQSGKFIETTCKPGDIVLVDGRNAITILEGQVFMVHESQIVAKLDPDSYIGVVSVQ